MRPSPRRALFAAAAAVLSLFPSGRASADHGGPPRLAGLSPLSAGLLAAALTLAVGIVAVVIVMLLTRRRPPSE